MILQMQLCPCSKPFGTPHHFCIDVQSPGLAHKALQDLTSISLENLLFDLISLGPQPSFPMYHKATLLNSSSRCILLGPQNLRPQTYN